MNNAKAIAGVMLVQLWLLVGAISWMYHLTRYQPLLAIPTSVFYVIGLTLGLVNYYTLVVRGRAVRFQHEFRQFPAGRKAVLITIGVGFIIFSVAFALFSSVILKYSART